MLYRWPVIPGFTDGTRFLFAHVSSFATCVFDTNNHTDTLSTFPTLLLSVSVIGFPYAHRSLGHYEGRIGIIYQGNAVNHGNPTPDWVWTGCHRSIQQTRGEGVEVFSLGHFPGFQVNFFKQESREIIKLQLIVRLAKGIYQSTCKHSKGGPHSA